MKQELLEIYERLYARFGAQKWWPAETPFEVMVGAILTQQVAWRNVEQAISNLKACGYLDVEMIHKTPVEVLKPHIRPTRFFNQKTMRLKALCALIYKHNGANIDAFLQKQNLRQLLLGLRGIGKETADSILLYAANRPIFVVDNYTARIISRIGHTTGKESYDTLQSLFHGHLEQNVALYNEYHALLVALGSNNCKKTNPRCSSCPLDDICAFATTSTSNL